MMALTARLEVRLPPAELERLRSVAARTDVSVSVFVRRAIASDLEFEGFKWREERESRPR